MLCSEKYRKHDAHAMVVPSRKLVVTMVWNSSAEATVVKIMLPASANTLMRLSAYFITADVASPLSDRIAMLMMAHLL